MSSVFRTWKIWVQFSGLNFWDLEKIDEKNQKKFKVPKMSKIVPECPNVFRSNFFEKKFAQCSMEGRVFEYFQKRSKLFQISKHAKKSFPKCPNVFWTCFGSIFLKIYLPSVLCRAFQIFWTENYEFRFSKLKNMSSNFRHNTQQTSFLHSRHSQYTQFHFRVSGLKFVSSDSQKKTWVQFSGLEKFEFSFPDLIFET